VGVEILIDAERDYNESLERRNSLRDICTSLASSSVDSEIKLFAYWIGDTVEVVKTVKSTMNNFFNADTMFFEKEYFYMLSLDI